MTKPLSHTSMLVYLSQRAWKATAVDHEVSAYMEQSYSAESGTMTAIKALCPKEIIQPIQRAMRLGRAQHYLLTTPGLFRGQHLLSTAMFETYAQTQQAIKDEFESRVRDFLSIYPKIVRNAARLGNAYKMEDFPDENSIKTFFEYTLQYQPVPDMSDWRMDGVDAEQVDAIRREAEEGVNAMYRKATEEVYTRAREVLEKLYNQATNYSLDAPGAMLRDATIEHIKEISSLVSSMNISGDPTLDYVGQQMLKEFSELKGKELRADVNRRSEVAAKAQKILARLNGASHKRAA